MKFKINKEVFEKFPNLVVYIPIISGFDNSKSEKNTEVSLKFKKQQEDNLRKKFSSIELLKEEKYINTYFECFKKFGEDPTKAMPTHFALAKRVVQGKDLPDINPIVNVYNSISIKYLTPFGGEDLDTVYGDFELKFANGDEHWLGIGEEKGKSPVKGNLIWQDDFDVSTISLNWRQCDRTKLTENSKNGYFIMDGFEGVNDINIKQAAEEFSDFITKNFGGKYEIILLNKEHSEVEISFNSKSIGTISKPKVEKEVQKSSSQDSHVTGKYQITNKQKKDDSKNLKEKIFEYPADSYEANIQNLLAQAIKQVYISEGIEKESPLNNLIAVMKTPDPKLGDFSSSIAMQKVKDFQSGTLPIDIAKKIVEKLTLLSSDFKVEAIMPGFINFRMMQSQVNSLVKVISTGTAYGSNDLYKGETWDFEHTSPNPNKALHIGHLRNNLTGMAIGRLGEFSGANVIFDCIDNNRGIAITKLMWGFLKFGRKDGAENTDISYWHSHQDEWVNPTVGEYLPDRFMDSMYVKASKDFDSNKEVEEKVRNMVVLWEAEDKIIRDLWKVVLGYSYEGQKRTLKRLGNRWDNVWHESEHYQIGKQYVEDGLKKGVFVRNDGAVVTDLEKYNLPNTVLIKKDGTSLYITQDIALNNLKKQKFNADKMFWVIGPEQSLAMKQLFVVCEQLGIGKRDEFVHLPYGYMTVKGQGKMSSRKGNVLFIDDLIDTIKSKIQEKLVDRDFTLEYKDALAETLALAAIKYNTLKVARMTDVAFDIEASTDFNGDSAIYILYGLVRAKSILKSSNFDENQFVKNSELTFRESQAEALYKKILEFSSVVRQSVEQFAPNYICLYLFQLAQLFNQFYDGVSIMKEQDEEYKSMKLMLLQAYDVVVTNGCKLLGIDTVEKM